MADPPKPLAPRRPDAPQALVDVVMKALAKDPDARYRTVAELTAALAPFAPPPEAAPWAGRRWAAVAVLVLVIVAAGVMAAR
jgi:hypothetical protein